MILGNKLPASARAAGTINSQTIYPGPLIEVLSGGVLNMLPIALQIGYRQQRNQLN